MQAATRFLLIIAGVLVLLGVTGAFYTVKETEQVIITQFGQPVGEPVTTAGLKFKVPFVQKINTIERLVLPWDGPAAEMPTKDKLYIIVDAFGRWQIKDPLTYFRRFTDRQSALSRLDDILGSEMRNTIARHDLVEVVRTTRDRKVAVDALGVGVSTAGLPPIRLGRVALEQEVFAAAKEKLGEFGIELLDIRFMRINYNGAVATKIYDRMISERRQIAERYRSEGAGEAAKILGNKERELRQIESEAYRQMQGIQGKADAEATTIYAQAYNASPQAREFYEFLRAMETYKTSFTQDATVVLTTDSALLRFLKGAAPVGSPDKPIAPQTPVAPNVPPPVPPPALEPSR